MQNLRGALAPFIASTVDGTVDVDATLAAVKVAWLAEVEASKVRDAEIETALAETFASLGVSIYPTPEVVSIASAMLSGGELTKLAGIADEVREYLSRSTLYKGERGRKGGLRKLA